jgi:hypothetical protein
MRSVLALLVLLGTLTAACADDSGPTVDDERFPDVIGATATAAGDGTWTVSATISSPYETADRYTDAWRILAPDGSVLGVRELLHDHAEEQPFTRALSGVVIEEGIAFITIEGRDQLSGWGGAVTEVVLDPPTAN